MEKENVEDKHVDTEKVQDKYQNAETKEAATKLRNSRK